jgi:hypothetical protein
MGLHSAGNCRRDLLDHTHHIVREQHSLKADHPTKLNRKDFIYVGAVEKVECICSDVEAGMFEVEHA